MSRVPVKRKLAPLVPKSVRSSFSRFLSSRHVAAGNFYRHVGQWPDLDDPKTFSEKLLWLQVNYLTPLMIDCSDKRIARDYVTLCGGEQNLIPLLHDDLDVNDIRPEVITEPQFVIKATHDSGTVMVCDERETFDWEGARRLLRDRLRKNYYWRAREPNYRPLKPKIIVETHAKYLDGARSEQLVDYKFYCINGSPAALMLMLEKPHAESGEMCLHHRFYDMETWEPLPWRRSVHPHDPVVQPKPPRLDEMVRVAKCLAAPFPFVRIDFMSANDGADFISGEITFYPQGGKSAFQPESLERQFGEQLKLPAAVDISAVQKAWYPGQGIDALRSAMASGNTCADAS